MGRLEKRYLLVQSLEKSYFLHLQKKMLPLKGKKIWGFILEVRTIGPITIVLEGQKKNAFISLVTVRSPLALSQNLVL